MPPICWAAIHGRQEVAKALIEAGAAINLPSIDANIKAEKTAIQYAREGGYNELADYLKARSDQAEVSNP